MNETTEQKIVSIIRAQKDFFNTRQTGDINFRIDTLKKLLQAVKENEKKIAEALWSDLHKSFEEAYFTEISLIYEEIKTHIRHVKKWAKRKSVSMPLHLKPSGGYILHEPLGVAFISAPWNYPFQLLINPLIGAISSGCCAVIKPSPYAIHTSQIIEDIISSLFAENYIAVVQGGREVNEILYRQPFDIIFFTGSPSLGKVVMKAASENLVPVVLELGGKSPCIVDKEATIEVAAKRIAWGKCLNAGQTCIAPDYLFVHQSVKEKLIEAIIKSIKEMFGDDAKQSNYFPRIIRTEGVERLQKLMQHGNIVYGGKVDKDEKYIEPTIIDNVDFSHPVMQEEIFGPLLPVLTFNNIEEVIGHLNNSAKPLAFYYFGKNKQAKEILAQTTSGGGCINDTIMHVATHKLPFGGVGNSGMGKYHGYTSFLAFSNARAIVDTPTCIDLPFKYPPFKYFNKIKKIL